jgi:hypothetical protein
MFNNPFDESDAYSLTVKHYERDWMNIWRRREQSAKRTRSLASVLISALSLFVP